MESSGQGSPAVVCTSELGVTSREQQSEKGPVCPLSPRSVPWRDLGLWRVTAEVKIDLASGEEGDNGLPEASWLPGALCIHTVRGSWSQVQVGM